MEARSDPPLEEYLGKRQIAKNFVKAVATGAATGAAAGTTAKWMGASDPNTFKTAAVMAGGTGLLDLYSKWQNMKNKDQAQKTVEKAMSDLINNLRNRVVEPTTNLATDSESLISQINNFKKISYSALSNHHPADLINQNQQGQLFDATLRWALDDKHAFTGEINKSYFALLCLNEVSKLFPSYKFLQTFRVDVGEVMIQGIAALQTFFCGAGVLIAKQLNAVAHFWFLIFNLTTKHFDSQFMETPHLLVIDELQREAARSSS